ncbi:aminomethyltransferase family protein [Georgenia ruanii]|nr:aminomethyltransferase family protein [Georgenia ruanii]MPV88567.1 hypothetical protein [Georgenia ruanii]
MAATSPAALLTTPLYGVHAAAHAALAPHAGWLVAARYPDPADELRALRERAGLVDLSHTGQVEVSGPDAAAAVAAALALPGGVPGVGGTAPAGLPGPAGSTAPGRRARGPGDLTVHRLAPAEFLVTTGTSDRLAVLDALLLASHRSGAERVLAADRTEGRVLLGLGGPAAPAVLRAAAGTAPAVGACTPGAVAGAPLVLARPCEGLLTLGGPAASAVALWDAVLAAGAPRGVRACGLEALGAVLGAGACDFPHPPGGAYGRPTSTDAPRRPRPPRGGAASARELDEETP